MNTKIIYSYIYLWTHNHNKLQKDTVNQLWFCDARKDFKMSLKSLVKVEIVKCRNSNMGPCSHGGFRELLIPLGGLLPRIHPYSEKEIRLMG